MSYYLFLYYNVWVMIISLMKVGKVNMKKKMFIGLMAAMAISLLVACQPKNNQSKEEAKPAKTDQVTKIKLGVMPSTDNIPFLLAQKEGFDQKNGVDLSLKVFKNPLDRDAALQAGEVDGVITDLVGVAIYQQGGLDVKVIGVPYDQFDLVVKDPAIQKLSDLKGKQVTFSKKTATAYAVDQMLQHDNLQMSDITVTEIPQVPTRLEMLKNDKVDGAILPEPFTTIAKAQGMHVLQSTKDIGVEAFAIGFPKNVLEQKKQGVTGLIAAYNEGADYVKEHDKAEYLDLFVENVGFPSELQDKIDIPDYGHLASVKAKDVTDAFKWSKKAGLLKKDITAEDVIYDYSK